MVSHTQIIRWLTADKFLSVFDRFVGLARKGLTKFIARTHITLIDLRSDSESFLTRSKVIWDKVFKNGPSNQKCSVGQKCSMQEKELLPCLARNYTSVIFNAFLEYPFI